VTSTPNKITGANAGGPTSVDNSVALGRPRRSVLALRAMIKAVRIRARWIAALFAAALIVCVLVLSSGSEAPHVTLQFKAITNSGSLGQVARFALSNHGKHPVQRLPLYVVEFQDASQRVITIAAPAVLQPASEQTIDVPLPQTASGWRLGVSCSPTGIRPRFRGWWDASRSHAVRGNAPWAFAYRIRLRVLDFLTRRFPANYVYVQSEWVDDHRLGP
jgi:hypothetical protein